MSATYPLRNISSNYFHPGAKNGCVFRFYKAWPLLQLPAPKVSSAPHGLLWFNSSIPTTHIRTPISWLRFCRFCRLPWTITFQTIVMLFLSLSSFRSYWTAIMATPLLVQMGLTPFFGNSSSSSRRLISDQRISLAWKVQSRFMPHCRALEICEGTCWRSWRRCCCIHSQEYGYHSTYFPNSMVLIHCLRQVRSSAAEYLFTMTDSEIVKYEDWSASPKELKEKVDILRGDLLST